MAAAIDMNAGFRAEIGKVFKDYGPRRRPFSAEQAIFFTYEGFFDDARKEREQVIKRVYAVFYDAYAGLSPPPALAQSSQYGYPAFEVMFRSKPEMAAAKNMNDAFRAGIGEIFMDYGPKSRPFSAEQAVSFTYEGFRDESRVRFRRAR